VARETAPGASVGRVSYRALFAVHGVSQLVAASLLVRTAATMWQVALVLFVLERFGSPVLAGFAVFVGIAPGIVVSPIGGVLLDRHGRVRLMVLDYIAAAAALALIAGLAFGDLLTPASLLAIVAVSSLTNPLGTAGARSLFPLVVPRPLWDRANAVDGAGYTLANVVGPPLAGVLVVLAGGEVAIALTAALFLAGAVALAGTPEPEATGAGESALVVAAREAFVYVLRHPTLRGLALGISTANLGHGIFIVALPVLVFERVHGDAALVGQLWALIGLVGAASGLLIGRLGSEGRERALMAAAMLIGGAAMAALAVTASPPVIVAVVALLGLTFGPLDIALFSLRQRRTDPAWFGRAFAVSMHLNYAGVPVGSAISGPLIGVSLTAALAAGAVFSLIAAALTLLTIPDS
jgi:MFS family permease